MSDSIKVLHVISGDLWAGAEVQAFTLMAHLKRMPETEVAAVVMNPGKLSEKLRSAGVTIWIFEERKNSVLELFRQTRRVAQEWCPDVIHTHRQKENILGAFVGRSCGTQVCVRTVHGAEEHEGLTGLRGVRRRSISAFDHWVGRTLQQRVIAVTQELGERMTAWFPQHKISVIENGVDFEELSCRPGIAEFRAAEPDALHIGFAGRLVGVKRVDLFLDAAAMLLQRDPERRWRFHVFGDGPLRGPLEERARKLRIEQAIVFHGHRDDMAACLAGLDVLVMCSDHEGMPMVALEAAALGVPTVAHAVGGLIEVVPGEFLVKRQEGEGYVEGILRAVGPEGRDIATRHAAGIRTRYSAVRNAERVRALYEQVRAERQREPVRAG